MLWYHPSRMARETRSERFSGGFPPSIVAFACLDDPRIGRNKRHYFGEILFMALAAIICQCEGFDDMARFARLRKPWLKRFLKLPNGTPSNDTFRRVFTAIDPAKFNECFIAFVRGVHGELGGQLVAIDGKALRRSLDRAADTGHLHLLSAYASQSGLTLGQLQVDSKSNEIKALPELLDLLDLEGHVVSLDAMGCQKEVARKLHLAGAHYLLALKANHPGLHRRVEEVFGSSGHIAFLKARERVLSSADVREEGHGRRERRIVLATDGLDFIDKNERDQWSGLRAIVCVEAHREEIRTGRRSVERRYYLTSLGPDAGVLQRLIRSHWSIENQSHWVLDVTWNEDASRIRKGNAAQNVALLRKLALNLLRADTTVKDSIRGKRLQATFSEEILETFLRLRPSK